MPSLCAHVMDLLDGQGDLIESDNPFALLTEYLSADELAAHPIDDHGCCHGGAGRVLCSTRSAVDTDRVPTQAPNQLLRGVKAVLSGPLVVLGPHIALEGTVFVPCPAWYWSGVSQTLTGVEASADLWSIGVDNGSPNRPCRLDLRVA